MRALGADGLRVLAIAGRDLAADWDGDPDDELDDLVLYGVVGILDPPRHGGRRRHRVSAATPASPSR
jgi:Ca2+-transporting ATPase